MTQVQLARKAGIGQATISDLERGRAAGSRELARIAHALGVDAFFLETGVNPPTSPTPARTTTEQAITPYLLAPTDDGRAARMLRLFAQFSELEQDGILHRFESMLAVKAGRAKKYLAEVIPLRARCMLALTSRNG